MKQKWTKCPWNKIVFILTTFSSQASLKIVILATVTQMMAFPFRWWRYGCLKSKCYLNLCANSSIPAIRRAYIGGDAKVYCTTSNMYL